METLTRQGDELTKKAQKKLRSIWPFVSRDDLSAAELFGKAGVKYRAANNWLKAGNAYLSAADSMLKCSDNLQSAIYLVEAAKSFQHLSNEEADQKKISCYLNAIECYIATGNFFRGARIASDLAEEYIKQKKSNEAITALNKSSDLLRAENRHRELGQCLERTANLTVDLKQFEKASGLYQSAISELLKTPIGRFQTKSLYLKSVLCLLSSCTVDNSDQQLEKAKFTLEEFQEIKDFIGSMEDKLANALILAIEKQDIDAAAVALDNYQFAKKPDETTLLLLDQVKRSANLPHSIL